MLSSSIIYTLRSCSLLLAVLMISSCKKFIEVGTPHNQLIISTVFSDDATATAAVTGIYGKMVSGFGFAGQEPNLVVMAGFCADELSNHSTQAWPSQCYTNNLTKELGTYTYYIWGQLYEAIYGSNAALEGLAASTGLTATVKKQLEGEARFMRAFCHFYLVNLYGDVPLVITTDYTANSRAVRTAQATVYEQIISDLQDAQNLMAGDYSLSQGERVRPNKWAAKALLARVYLYTKDWARAEAAATEVIGNPDYAFETDLTKTFLKSSTEAIWQLMPVANQVNAWEGISFVLTGQPTMSSASTYLQTAFEAGDQRKTDWMNSITVGGQTYFYPYKYKVRYALSVTEYSIVLRLSEQYLVRAEARAQQNNIDDGQDDLDIVRDRAHLPGTTASDQPTLLAAIAHERQVELFAEWGHRWFDLKRTAKADNVLGAIKGSNWQTTDQYFPIPLTEIQKNPALVQNDGY